MVSLHDPKARKAALVEALNINADALALQRMLSQAVQKKIQSNRPVELPAFRPGKKARVCKDGAVDGRSVRGNAGPCGTSDRRMHSFENRADHIVAGQG